jgi:hypothetical protein
MTLLQEGLFVLTHLGEALTTKRRQVLVGLDMELPPDDSTVEEFPNLPVVEAAKRIKQASCREHSGGVPRSAWSEEDQGRLMRGERPKGVPEHPNV